MKILFLTLGMFSLVIFKINAQVKTEKYCQVQSYITGFSNKFNARLILAGEDSVSENKNQDLIKIRTLKNNPEILNFMALHGWKLIGITGSVGPTNFFFKKDD